MGLRPSDARWFEVLTPREQLASALSCLASTGEVELQAHSEAEPAVLLPGLEAGRAEYEDLAQRYGAWWPDPALDREPSLQDPETVLTAALAGLRAWVERADPIVHRLDELATENAQLRLLIHLLEASKDRLPDLERLSAAGPYIATRVYRLPSDVTPDTLPPSVIVDWIDGAGVPHLLVVGPVHQVERADEQLSELDAVRIRFPSGLPRLPASAAEEVRGQLEENEDSRRQLTAQLARLNDAHDVAGARGDLEFIEWFGACAPLLPTTEHFAWITGWTSDLDGKTLDGALTAGRVDHVFRFTDPPPGARSPVVLHNPPWIRPFELFARLMGVPGTGEADPSALVALVAPLMFGYMFADVGQGAVVIGVGLALRRRWPVMGLLVSGGAFAMVFGVFFGSLFSMEGIIPALWLHPLAEPSTVLGVTLAAGVVILGLGLCLDLVQAVWQRRTGRWLAVRGGLIVAWLGAVLALVAPVTLWGTLLGAVWFVAGYTVHGGGSLGAFAAAWGELVERLLQLLVNTISFVRVGAFALAHAGLSAAVVGMAEATGSSWGGGVVLVIGNAGIIALEGLVVGVQTTRLVLFEFFTRFLVASGRPFRPLARPGARNRRLS